MTSFRPCRRCVHHVIRWLLCVWFLALFPPPVLSGASSTIQWLEWGDQAFDRAEAEDKLIVLDLTAVWCHACHVMDETTYADPLVVRVLNSEFIPVRVETDQRPDVEARYGRGGWPTTSILLPSGEILFQANVLPPEAMIEALRTSAAFYRENKRDVMQRAAEVWEKVEGARRSRVQPRGTIHPAMETQILNAMKMQYDHVHGGFRDAPKFFEPEAIHLAFARRFWRHDSECEQMALFTLDQQLKLYDPVWGGFFRYAEEADWSKPHYEKMLLNQASNLINYLEAYQLTQQRKYREIVEGTMQYVMRFLADREHGGFYASQSADVHNVVGSGPSISGDAFFALNEVDRLTAGIPYVDRTILTDGNGLMAASYLKVAQAMGHSQAREFALKTLRRLYKERYQPGRGLAHLVQKGHPREFGLLADQVFFTGALIEAFVTTGVLRYLEHAEAIMADAVSLLEDTQGGGFFDRVPGMSALGLLKFPHKDLAVNAALSIVFSDLFYLTGKSLYREKAQNVLQFLVGRTGPLPIAQIGRAINRFLHYPVHIVVIGEKSKAEAQSLFLHGLALYVPGKIVRFLDPRVDSLSIGEVTFPKVSAPLAYVCTERLCSSPIARADALPDRFQEVFTALTEAQKPFSMRNGTSALNNLIGPRARMGGPMP